MMDVYDLVYEEVRRNSSSFRKEELTVIHETVSYTQSWLVRFWHLAPGLAGCISSSKRRLTRIVIRL